MTDDRCNEYQLRRRKYRPDFSVLYPACSDRDHQQRPSFLD